MPLRRNRPRRKKAASSRPTRPRGDSIAVRRRSDLVHSQFRTRLNDAIGSVARLDEPGINVDGVARSGPCRNESWPHVEG